MRLFNAGGAAESLLARGGVDESVPLTGRMVSGAIQRAQNSIESRNAEIRKNVLKYDDVLTKQRKKLYEERARILEGEDLDEHIERFIDEVIGGTIDAHAKGVNGRTSISTSCGARCAPPSRSPSRPRSSSRRSAARRS